MTKNTITVATWLTLLRIVLTIPVGIGLALGWSVVATVLIIICAVTDFLDGWIARKRNEVSALGAALDPTADKILTAVCLIGFVAGGQLSGIHLIPVFAIMVREVLIGGLREATPDGVTLAVTGLAKIKTTVQFVAFVVLAAGIGSLGTGLIWVAAALTVYTGFQYVMRWVTILSS